MIGIYTPFRQYFLATFFSLALTLVNLSVSDDSPIAIVIAILSLIISIVQIRAIYQLRSVSPRFGMAFRLLMVSLIGILISTICVIAAFFISSILLAVVSGVLIIVFALFSLAATYQFIWGLDEQIPVRGYEYPQGKLKISFWISIVSALGVGALQTQVVAALILGAICSIIVLWIYYEFLQAVKQKEQP